jgi:hypothetical protein
MTDELHHLFTDKPDGLVGIADSGHVWVEGYNGPADRLRIINGKLTNTTTITTQIASYIYTTLKRPIKTIRARWTWNPGSQYDGDIVLSWQGSTVLYSLFISRNGWLFAFTLSGGSFTTIGTANFSPTLLGDSTTVYDCLIEVQGETAVIHLPDGSIQKFVHPNLKDDNRVAGGYEIYAENALLMSRPAFLEVWASDTPTLDSFARDLYESIEPLAYADADNNYSLAEYCVAIGEMFQIVEDLGRDQIIDDVQYPGWSVIMDIDRAPTDALGWLAQFVGVRTRTGLNDKDQRDRIKSTAGWSRGTVSALQGAISTYLTGTKTFVFRERYDRDNPTIDAPYYLDIVTYTAETPNPAAALQALMAQKPAGIILRYVVLGGQDYAAIKSKYVTYTALKNAYSTYEEMKVDYKP